MDKRINGLAVKLFCDEVARVCPEFKPVRAKQSWLPNGIVLEMKVSNAAKCWGIFGGYSDSAFELGLFGAWTTEGRNLAEVAAITEGKLAISSGWVDLRDGEQFGNGVDDSFVALSVPAPPTHLQAQLLQSYLESDEFRAHMDKIEKLESRRKNPEPRQHLEQLYARSEQASMELWSHVLDRSPDAFVDLERTILPVISTAASLLCLRGHRLLKTSR